MPTPTFYCLDANVYFDAGRDYYSFDLCDSFWQHLVAHSGDRIVSIDRIKAELTVHDNQLARWVKGHVPRRFSRLTGPK